MRFLAICLLVLLAPLALRAQGTYRCPPCNAACDAKAFAAPGSCPDCGMPLMKEGEVVPAKKRVAILIFEGVQIIDFAGPYEVFGHTDCEVFTVAEKAGPLTTAMGQTLQPKYTFAACPKADILVIPGGNVDDALLKNEAIRNWIVTRTPEAEVVLSVCNGAFLLAKTGLLDGKTATTFHRLIKQLQITAPNVKVVYDQRLVDNGKFITTAGLSSGLDGALHVIERIWGRGQAQSTALAIEYDWKPEGGFVRAALADQEFPDVNLADITAPKILRTEGDRKAWHFEIEFGTPRDLKALHEGLRQDLTKKGWTCEPQGPGRSQWRFQGRDGSPWQASLRIEALGGQRFRLRIELHKA